MSGVGFYAREIEHDWQQLIRRGPRFLGTPNEAEARNYILDSLAETSARVEEHEFGYQGWSLIEPPQLQVISPSFYTFPCEAMIRCGSTPLEGISGRLQYIGTHKVIEEFQWEKFAVVDPDGAFIAYISGRPDGPAQPQPLGKTNAALPHFVVGAYELSLLKTWWERQLKIEVHGRLQCESHPEARTRNLIASFNPDSPKKRICLGAHYDSVYSAPGANDNAGAVAALLAIARRMSVENPDFPLDLLFFSAEEWDMLGSKAYVAHLAASQTIETIKMMINLDSIAEGSSLELWVGPESFEEQLLKAAQDYTHHPAGRKIISRFPPPYSSDHMPFYEAGVPACTLFCGNTVKYHIPQDTYCPEGVTNILYVTEFTWHLVQTFARQEVIWRTWQERTENGGDKRSGAL